MFGRSLFEAVLGLREERAERTFVHALAFGFLRQTPLQGDWLDDLENGDLVGGTGEGEAASGASFWILQTGLGEILEDLGQKALGDGFVPLTASIITGCPPGWRTR